MTFVGLDLHKRYITACALDGRGTLLAEVRQLPDCDTARSSLIQHRSAGASTARRLALR
jgi:hypothetical protein